MSQMADETQLGSAWFDCRAIDNVTAWRQLRAHADHCMVVNCEDDPVTRDLDPDNLRSGASDLHKGSLSLRFSPKIKLAIGKIRGWDLERLDVTRYE